MTFKVVVDSTFYLSEEEIKKYDIKRASLNILDGDDTHRELDTENEFVFDALKHHRRLSTSQPSPAEFLHLYEKCLEEGADKVFVLTLAEPLSGTYQSAEIAKKMLDDPDKVHLFKSQMAAFGNEMLTLELIDMINQKKSEQEIIDRINTLNDRSYIMFTIENLIHLMRSGRLSRAKALVGTVLRVKPILHTVKGKLEIHSSERTHKKVMATLLDEMKRTTEGAKNIIIRIVSKNSLENASTLKSLIEETFTKAKVTFSEYVGPVFSIHLGTNAYGVSWTSE
ncbi:DegV family protein [Candidatus Xianfuyuplasma coldseepsis]|uniref:DegV family protein n=1 Tax=Candidatus Xianfuyuplasma coldseepsis TaxID=2782163 RepID=A0A7L7KQS8_9MOLU|nr:DegV family protein [Xianfuyuplasma coldseepsis]QMS84789.1 DegV family protein [Xianfuyuplasma coldseepsis]